MNSLKSALTLGNDGLLLDKHGNGGRGQTGAGEHVLEQVARGLFGVEDRVGGAPLLRGDAVGADEERVAARLAGVRVRSVVLARAVEGHGYKVGTVKVVGKASTVLTRKCWSWSRCSGGRSSLFGHTRANDCFFDGLTAERFRLEGQPSGTLELFCLASAATKVGCRALSSRVDVEAVGKSRAIEH